MLMYSDGCSRASTKQDVGASVLQLAHTRTLAHAKMIDNTMGGAIHAHTAPYCRDVWVA